MRIVSPWPNDAGFRCGIHQEQKVDDHRAHPHNLTGLPSGDRPPLRAAQRADGAGRRFGPRRRLGRHVDAGGGECRHLNMKSIIVAMTPAPTRTAGAMPDPVT